MDRGVLERDHELERLAAAARDAADGAGSVALVLGEAGIGKSSLVKAMPCVLPAEARILVGECDDLATRRPLGPFRDLVGSVGTELARALTQGGDRARVYDALRAELTAAPHPAVLVVEDVHWADEASLDVLRFLVHRVERLPAVLVLTYRDDELDRAHPLRHLLGQVSRAERVHRLPLSRLSVQAVHRLSAASRLDPAEVYAVTSGNPFFVAEVLAAGGTGGVPPTVVDAVLARLRGLDDRTRDVLEQLAVVPSAVERPLVDALLTDGVAELAAAERRGMLTVTPERAGFRHELIRRAIADSLPAARRIELNRAVLAALVAAPDSDPSRVVHHAAEAGDQEAIVRYGPDAARDAAEAGAHREAAAHLRLVLRQRDRFGSAELAGLLERYAVESYTIADSAAAVGAERDAVALRRSLGDTRALGADLRWLSRIHWWAGDADEAQRAAREAIAVGEDAGDDRLLALALSNTSQLHMLSDRHTEAIDFGERAIALAHRTDDPAILAHALNNVGSARWRSGDPLGRAQVEESLKVALAAGEIDHACRSYANLIWSLLENLQYAEADRFLAPAMELADRAEHLGFLSYFHVELALRRFAAGAWDDAEQHAELGAHDFVPARCPALTVLARVRVRRGRSGAGELLDQAREIAVHTRELQRIGPVAAAQAEAAWLRGDRPAVVDAAGEAFEQARGLAAVPYRAELGYWLTKAGHPIPPDSSDHPYALQSAGRWREAARAWLAAGCPYEHAAALAESAAPEDKLAALSALDVLGAQPLARLIRGELRRIGVRHIPRGPLAVTRDNPAGLTERQLQVMRLLAQGLTNHEIAERLVLSVRTVDNHVSAVLEKLGARTRREVSVHATELGLLPGSAET
ncbi:ATP-binding protein [Streptomyces yerevanensis]|uniref:ATP-binding protein n=1 Tax=Streptomyces yerevanensis TaxID=66378 RepID=UPI000525C4C1|nr:LuxR family transcriptional regulator [Streptomyces yerevanensis]